MAVRRTRERLLSCLAPADAGPAIDRLDAVAHDGPDPAERAERREHLDQARAALAALKANERIAILLQAQGYSYAEICELCGWTYTKLNRSLSEGRARLRSAAISS
jgi:DNA-directed RNA polymerase specialized sigma24 family protein